MDILQCGSEESMLKPANVQDVFTIYLYLCTGMLIAVLLWLAEMAIAKFVTRRARARRNRISIGSIVRIYVQSKKAFIP